MLLEELGYSSDERLLIINADDFGMCNSTNRAVHSLLEGNFITSTSLMFTCPWMIEAAAMAKAHPEFDVGVHLTFTSEWDSYKWGPITRFEHQVPFVDERGYFPAGVIPVGRAHPEDIRRESIAQIETALSLDVDLTHLDNHMISLHGVPGSERHYMEIMIELASKYGLPLRLPRTPYDFIPHDEDVIKMADEHGVVIPDHLAVLPFAPVPELEYGVFKQMAGELLRNLSPGVTEFIFHPSLDSDELQGITSTWKQRNMEFALFRDPDIQKLIQDEQITKLKWRDLRNLQRNR